jgi:aminopeptidase N
MTLADPIAGRLRPVISTALIACTSLAIAQSNCQDMKRHRPTPHAKSNNRELAPIDLLHQRITLDLTLGASIKGNCAITAVPRTDGLTNIALDLEALTVDSVVMNGVALAFTHPAKVLDIQLPAAAGTSDTLDLTVYYGGTPVVDGSGWGGFYTPGSIIYNMGVGFESIPHSMGRAWFPCLDDFTERSTYEFFIKTAGGKKAWCNGALMGRTQLNGDTLINHWKLDETIPAYLASVVAANFAVARDTFPNVSGGNTPVEFIAFPIDTAGMKLSFTNLQAAFDHFETHFGPYRWNKVGYALTPIGAMEHATSIHYQRDLATGSLQYESTMAHELAHHWFGDLITCDRAEEMYINEGFAEYLSYLFLEEVYGRDRYMREVRQNHRAMVQRAHQLDEGWWALSEMPQEWTYGEHTYNKGADVLHTLRSYMGDEAFSTGLTSFMNTYAFQPVNTTMLRDHLTSAIGMDMTDYFADWIQQPGWAAFEIDAQSFTPGDDGWIVQLAIGQKQRGPAQPYNNVPITVAIVGTVATNVFRDTVRVGGTSTDLSFTIPFEPAWVWLNDDDRLSLATTGVTDTTSTTAWMVSDLANFEIHPQAGDTAVVRMEQYWVAADEGTYEEPYAYVISPDRYWRITGNWGDAQRFSARVTYDGRSAAQNNLDVQLMRDTLGATFNEDSLVMLHRPRPDAPWRLWSADVEPFGSTTDKYGRMDLDSLAAGEYALAWRTSAVGIEESMQDVKWTFGPNPATDVIDVRTDGRSLTGTMLLLDSSGRLVGTTAMKGRNITLPTTGLNAGAYALSFSDGKAPAVFIGNVIVEP